MACGTGRTATAAKTVNISFNAFQGTTRKTATIAVGTLPSGVTVTTNTAATASADGSLVLTIASGANLGGTTAAYDNVQITLTVTANSTAYKFYVNISKQITGATGSRSIRYLGKSATVGAGVTNKNPTDLATPINGDWFLNTNDGYVYYRTAATPTWAKITTTTDYRLLSCINDMIVLLSTISSSAAGYNTLKTICDTYAGALATGTLLANAIFSKTITLSQALILLNNNNDEIMRLQSNGGGGSPVATFKALLQALEINVGNLESSGLVSVECLQSVARHAATANFQYLLGLMANNIENDTYIINDGYTINAYDASESEGTPAILRLQEFASGYGDVYCGRDLYIRPDGSSGTRQKVIGQASGHVFRGAYSSSKEYKSMDVVSYNGNSYQCISACKNVTPTNTSYWKSITSFYVVLSNGLKIQWVLVTSTSTWTTKDVIFPVSFANTKYAVFANPDYVNSPNTYPVGTKKTGVNTVRVSMAGGSLYNVNVLAIGI